jgi:hypothetical protein
MSIIARDIPPGNAPWQVQPPEYEWPFLMNGDSVSFVVTRYYKQRVTDYNADRLAARYLPGVYQDPEHPGAYMIAESRADRSQSALVSFTRTFARVPLPQETYSSYSISKPTIPNEASTTWTIASVRAQGVSIATAVLNDSGFWFSNNEVFSPFITPNAAMANAPATGGTFTLTYKTSTTAALAYNESNANIQTALNGLADVISDGLTFDVGNSLTNATNALIGLNATVGTTLTLVTLDATGLTVASAAARNTFSYFTTSTNQTLALAKYMTSAGHGLTAGVPLFAGTNQGTSVLQALRYPAGDWGVHDANTLFFWQRYTAAPSASFQYLAPYFRTYTPGATVLSSRISETFYLPGVTPGIATVADIPIEVPNIGDADVIAAALGAGGFQPVQFTGPERWRDGPIYFTTTTGINFDNL